MQAQKVVSRETFRISLASCQYANHAIHVELSGGIQGRPHRITRSHNPGFHGLRNGLVDVTRVSMEVSN